MRLRTIILSVLISLFAATALSQSAFVTGENAYLRGTPSETGAVVDTLVVNSTVHIITQTADWYLVQSFPFVGWIHRSLLRVNDSAKKEGRVDNASIGPRSDADSSNVSGSSKTVAPATQPIGSTEQRVYIRGPRGGCYYLQEDGKKVYVAHRLCSTTDKSNED